MSDNSVVDSIWPATLHGMGLSSVAAKNDLAFKRSFSSCKAMTKQRMISLLGDNHLYTKLLGVRLNCRFPIPM